jgi:hypothetical protein
MSPNHRVGLVRAQIAATRFEIVQIDPTGVAIVSLDGEPKHLVLPNTTRVCDHQG